MNNHIFSGTMDFSLWRRSLSGIIGINRISESVPLKYLLSQNYPNPSNLSAVIKFEIPNSENGIPMNRDAKNANGKIENGYVSLKIYDLLGKEVETLVNEKLQPGTYEVTLNATQFPRGVYFYKLMIESYSQTKRMLFIK